MLLFCAWALKLEKALDEWEEMSSWNQNWDKFQSHFLEAEEGFNSKRRFMTRKVALAKYMQ